MNLPVERMISELGRPRAFEHRPRKVQIVQTHISLVFIAGEKVFKVKKPVDFGFLDFTTLEKRERYCREEVRLNRRLSPDVYLDVVPVTEEAGRLRFGGEGSALDYAVVMTRLDERRMLSELLRRGKARREDVLRIADRVALFHQEAKTSDEITRIGGTGAVDCNTEENFRQVEPYVGDTLTPETFEVIAGYTRTFREVNEGLFLRREKEGWIRDGHGDLHSQHICLTDGIQIFDCIEFNQRFRFADVLCDAAFLAMDLDRLGHRRLAQAYSRRYLERTGQTGVEGLYNFYTCYRAVVRGKVEGFRSRDPDVPGPQARAAAESARSFFTLAERYARAASPPVLLATVGLMGCGKTSLASALSGKLDLETLSSDRVRKELASLKPTERRHVPFGQDIYSRPFTDRTYGELHRRAALRLADGGSVLLDASYIDPAQRKRAVDAARRSGARIFFLYLQAGEKLLRERLRARSGTDVVTDGREEILSDQIAAFNPPEPDREKVITLDAGRDLGELVGTVYRRVLSTT